LEEEKRGFQIAERDRQTDRQTERKRDIAKEKEKIS